MGVDLHYTRPVYGAASPQRSATNTRAAHRAVVKLSIGLVCVALTALAEVCSLVINSTMGK